MLDSKQPQSEEWKKFREALSKLSDRFDKKEIKEKKELLIDTKLLIDYRTFHKENPKL